MFGIKYIPHCLGCGAENQKLSMKSMCSKCEWAISQRDDLDGVRLENKVKSEELKSIQDRIESTILEGAILLERNGELRAELVKAHRRIKSLEAVK